MKIQERIDALAALGVVIDQLSDEEREALYVKASSFNNWFTRDSIESALAGVKLLLDKENLTGWVARYRLDPVKPKNVGVVMAGNIPMVGFHDFLSVLVSGHRLHMKLSSQDPFLIEYFSKKLVEIAPGFQDLSNVADLLKGMDAIIATGSDNSSRYFEYYFSKLPNIIRKNRMSCAVIAGNETPETLVSLGADIFQYYGLGCRNVSKLYVPEGYDFKDLIENVQPFQHVMLNHKYTNNYDYNKSIFLVNQEPHLDTGFALLRETQEMVSPIAVIYYEYYKDSNDLREKLASRKDKIQCIVGSSETGISGVIPFGSSQMPGLEDYADDINTLDFLENLADHNI